MELIRGIHNIKQQHRNSCVTLGNFDGVHRGHQMVIQQLCSRAQERQQKVMVITFEPQPLEYLRPQLAPPRLFSLREKVQHLSQLPCTIDFLLVLRFSTQLSQLSAVEFIKQLLVKILAVAYLVVGDDFRFGYQRDGNFKLLQDVGKDSGFKVERTQSLCHVTGERVSSTRIREALNCGDFNLARELLGRDYEIGGRVIRGAGKGHHLGAATANIFLDKQKPPFTGVYIVVAKIIGEKKFRHAVAHIGLRPTLTADSSATKQMFGVGKDVILEVHILDFAGDLYHQRLVVRFCKKIRDETRFANLSELSAHIKKDITLAREYFNGLEEQQ